MAGGVSGVRCQGESGRGVGAGLKVHQQLFWTFSLSRQCEATPPLLRKRACARVCVSVRASQWHPALLPLVRLVSAAALRHHGAETLPDGRHHNTFTFSTAAKRCRGGGSWEEGVGALHFRL